MLTYVNVLDEFNVGVTCVVVVAVVLNVDVDVNCVVVVVVVVVIVVVVVTPGHSGTLLSPTNNVTQYWSD